MNDLFTIIQGRRSIRAMDSRPLADEDLNKVLEAIRWAPSWVNSQCWEVVVAKDPQVKKALQDSMADRKNPAANAMVDAPVVLVMCAKKGASGYYKGAAATKFGDWMMFDLGMATQNLCLMAHSLGLGTVVVGLFDHQKAAEVVDLPAGYELVAMVPMGYPAREATAPKRRAVSEFAHDNRW
jgi:nitroreductase